MIEKKYSNTLIGVKVSSFAENSIRTQIALFRIWRKIDPPLFFHKIDIYAILFQHTLTVQVIVLTLFQKKNSGFRTSFVNFSVFLLIFLLKLVQPQIKHKISIFLTCCLPKELNFNLQYLKKKRIVQGAVGNTIPSDIELFSRKYLKNITHQFSSFCSMSGDTNGRPLGLVAWCSANF